MPSAIGHAAPALALIPFFRAPDTARRLWLLGVLCAAAPDLDVFAFRFGSMHDLLAHRGLSHSLPFAVLLGCAVAAAAFSSPRWRDQRARAALYLSLATATHGVLDLFTNGGHGIALLAPFDDTRWFSNFRPIQVSPIGVRRFFSARGVAVLANELVWLWLPCALVFALGLWRARRRRTAA